VVAASAVRLSYFGTFGLSTDAKYTGLAMDNNSLALVFVFLFTGFFIVDQFSIVLLVTCLILTGLNVPEIKTPKLLGNPISVYGLGVCRLSITGFYLWRLY
jgi:phosphatidylserine synthase